MNERLEELTSFLGAISSEQAFREIDRSRLAAEACRSLEEKTGTVCTKEAQDEFAANWELALALLHSLAPQAIDGLLQEVPQPQPEAETDSSIAIASEERQLRSVPGESLPEYHGIAAKHSDSLIQPSISPHPQVSEVGRLRSFFWNEVVVFGPDGRISAPSFQEQLSCLEMRLQRAREKGDVQEQAEALLHQSYLFKQIGFDHACLICLLQSTQLLESSPMQGIQAERLRRIVQASLKARHRTDTWSELRAGRKGAEQFRKREVARALESTIVCRIKPGLEEHVSHIRSRLRPEDPFVSHIVSRSPNELLRLTRKHRTFPSAHAAQCATTHQAMVEALYFHIKESYRFQFDNEVSYDPVRQLQYIRTPSEIESNFGGNCADLAMLAASLIARVQLRPLYLQTRGSQGRHPHALAGALIRGQTATLDDYSLYQAIQSGEAVIFDPTGLVSDNLDREFKIFFHEARCQAEGEVSKLQLVVDFGLPF